MSITKKKFGTTKDGREVQLYTVKKADGMEMSVTNLGATLVNLLVPNPDGTRTDVVLGYDKLEDYEVNDCFFGTTVGRNAGRIAGAAFTIDGVTYHLAANEMGNNLHSDKEKGFHKVVWEAELLEEQDAVRFSHTSPDGDCGFPGTLRISVTYTLLEDHAVQISYEGVSDKKTVINVTNHSYFNLRGHDAGDICEEKVMICADGFTELGEGSIPTGRILPVEGTPMDLRVSRCLKDSIDADDPQLTLAGGYDHNWALNTEFGKLQQIAQVEDEKAGRIMEVWSDLPGVQFYTGNAITPQTGKGKAHYQERQGLCLETQYFPNSVNMPQFRQAIFDAGEVYRATTIYRFKDLSKS